MPTNGEDAAPLEVTSLDGAPDSLVATDEGIFIALENRIVRVAVP